MVAGNFFMQMPPDPFDRVRFRSIGRKKVELHSATPFFQVLFHFATAVRFMKRAIVTDHMDDTIAPVASPQVVQVCEKQVSIASGARLTEDDLWPDIASCSCRA